MVSHTSRFAANPSGPLTWELGPWPSIALWSSSCAPFLSGQGGVKPGQPDPSAYSDPWNSPQELRLWRQSEASCPAIIFWPMPRLNPSTCPYSLLLTHQLYWSDLSQASHWREDQCHYGLQSHGATWLLNYNTQFSCLDGFFLYSFVFFFLVSSASSAVTLIFSLLLVLGDFHTLVSSFQVHLKDRRQHWSWLLVTSLVILISPTV